MLSTQIPEEFKDIRPYAPDELPQVFQELLADPQFMHVATKIVPDLSAKISQALPLLASGSGGGSLAVQKAFFYPLVKDIINRCTKGTDLSVPTDFNRQQSHTFITNHRDIVLDSAFLSVLLVENGFPTTTEIAIGDNLLIFPWIKKLVRINKSFVVQRSLSMHEMLRASALMSRYMHFAISQKHENIWIAQREGRAKDSDDRTQESLLKMMVMGGEGTVVERLCQLHLAPMALSYE
nr:1-acyl-sn-glycerol-3-phosphate acyltransferase [Bacteroidaceae bacterium]